MISESVGENFSDRLLIEARDKTLQVIREVAAQMRPGVIESTAKTMILEAQTLLGAARNWHPPQIRFGVNTLLPFGVPGESEVTLQQNDIFFFDIGPVFHDHEGDVGRSFAVGSDPEHRQCCEDVEKIWNLVRDYWSERSATGPELYAFAEEKARALGWELSLRKANGHRIADFPHAARRRGDIENFLQTPASNRWILEIQIRHPQKPFGAFFEDLLN